MSDRQSAKARSSRMVEPQVSPPVGEARVWHAAVNGYAQSVVVIATTGHGKSDQG
ncbi:MAG: hypothetical protein NW223_11290 [Hyphomicrobiaceae bacterium]|nr:hypothetical protein [Hyphomicrobiaceae bacterium]